MYINFVLACVNHACSVSVVVVKFKFYLQFIYYHILLFFAGSIRLFSYVRLFASASLVGIVTRYCSPYLVFCIRGRCPPINRTRLTALSLATLHIICPLLRTHKSVFCLNTHFYYSYFFLKTYLNVCSVLVCRWKCFIVNFAYLPPIHINLVLFMMFISIYCLITYSLNGAE